MEIQIFRALWGMTGTLAECFARIQAQGYTGVEWWVPAEPERSQLRELLNEYRLPFIAQFGTSGSSVAEHLDSFARHLDAVQPFTPQLVVSQSGSDAWEDDEVDAFFAEALRMEAASGLRVAHETHRSRILFHPRAARRAIQAFPDLRFCADLSHWVVVGERLITDQEAIIAACATRCLHVHARVGFEQGPQVPDPRAPEYAAHVAAHERWWEIIWEAQQAQGAAVTTLTPEYGPPLYLPTLPYTQAPVVDLETICDSQAARQKGHFAGWLAATAHQAR